MSGIQSVSRQWDELQTRHSEKLWAQYTTGLDFGVQTANQDKLNFLKDLKNFKMVEDSRERSVPGTDDRRGAELLYRLFQPHHRSERADALLMKIKDLENKLGDILNKHRSLIDGKEMNSPQINKILSQNPDREQRRKAYLSRTPVNKKLVEAGFLQLIDLRKEYAVACGFSDFVAYRLDEDELPPDLAKDWQAMSSQHRQARQDQLRNFAQQSLQLEDLKPWDKVYLKSQLCPYRSAKVNTLDFLPPLEKVFKTWGFELQGLNLTFDVFPRKNKSEWGYNFPLGIGRDSRVLANIDDQFAGFWVLLHETAHGVHFLNLNPEEHMLNRGVSGIVAEGFANFFGDQSYSREFLRQFFPGEIDTVTKTFAQMVSLDRLGVFEQIAMTAFDQALYHRDLRSLADINDLNWSMRKDFLGEEPFADEPPWGHMIHHTVAPIYLHNYFLGDVLWAQLQDAFFIQTGKVWSQAPAEFGEFQRDRLLRPAGRQPLMTLIETACGGPLNLQSYLSKSIAPVVSC